MPIGAPVPQVEPRYYATAVGAARVCQIPKKPDQNIVVTDVEERPGGGRAVTTGVRRLSDAKMPLTAV